MKRPTKDSVCDKAIPATFRSRLRDPFHRNSPGNITTASSSDDAQPDAKKVPGSLCVSDVISRYRPVIERVVLDGLVGIAEDKLQDDVLVASIFK